MSKKNGSRPSGTTQPLPVSQKSRKRRKKSRRIKAANPRTYLDNMVGKFGHGSYQDYLKSEHWKTFQTRYRDSGLPTRCVACNFPKIELHHVCYDRLGEEWLSDVIALCDRCHEAVHTLHKQRKIPLANIGLILKLIFQWDAGELDSHLREWTALRDKEHREWLIHNPEEEQKRRLRCTELQKNAEMVGRLSRTGYSTIDISRLYRVDIEAVEYFLRTMD